MMSRNPEITESDQRESESTRIIKKTIKYQKKNWGKDHDEVKCFICFQYK